MLELFFGGWGGGGGGKAGKNFRQFFGNYVAKPMDGPG